MVGPVEPSGAETRETRPRHRDLERRPRSYLVSEEDFWPDGDLRHDAPREAVMAQWIAQRFRDACADEGGLSTHKVAAMAGNVSQTAVYNLLHGRSWLDLPTIARLERTLGVTLWVHQPPTLKARPRDYLRDADDCWVGGCLIAGAPPEAELAQQVSKAFHTRCDHKGYDVEQAATKAGISPTAVRDVLDGNTWLDLPTIARIEGRLKLELWAGQHPVDTYSS